MAQDLCDGKRETGTWGMGMGVGWQGEDGGVHGVMGVGQCMYPYHSFPMAAFPDIEGGNMGRNGIRQLPQVSGAVAELEREGIIGKAYEGWSGIRGNKPGPNSPGVPFVACQH